MPGKGRQKEYVTPSLIYDNKGIKTFFYCYKLKKIIKKEEKL